MTEQLTETTDIETDVDDTVAVEDQDLHAADETTGETAQETFPRAYVEELREESKKYRQRAADRDEIAQRLHTALVAATGRLADPSDLPYDDGHLSDAETLSAAIDDLLDRKPHLAARRVSGNVGQGASETASVDLAGLLRARA